MRSNLWRPSRADCAFRGGSTASWYIGKLMRRTLLGKSIYRSSLLSRKLRILRCLSFFTSIAIKPPSSLLPKRATWSATLPKNSKNTNTYSRPAWQGSCRSRCRSSTKIWWSAYRGMGVSVFSIIPSGLTGPHCFCRSIGVLISLIGLKLWGIRFWSAVLIMPSCLFLIVYVFWGISDNDWCLCAAFLKLNRASGCLKAVSTKDLQGGWRWFVNS